MKVWIYCFSNKCCIGTKLEERKKKMLQYANERKMEVMGVSSLEYDSKSQLKNVLKKIGRMRGDGIVIYDMEELSHYERSLLMDALHMRKITIFCCKYAGNEVI